MGQATARRRFPGLFVTGTDTGVGKTLMAGGLAALFRERGVDVGVMKPVETGCPRRDGQLIAEDARFLRKMSGAEDEMELIAPYSLAQPLAPAVAAPGEGVNIDLAVIQRAYCTLSRRHELVIVEGAGGLLVPVTGRYFMADLARLLALPLLVVARASLGTINHSLLTLHYARREALPVLGLVMNHTTPEAGAAEKTNATALKRWADCPFLGTLPYLPVISQETLISAMAHNLDLAPLANRLGRV